MNGLNYFFNAFSKQNFFNFKGRARRAEYGWFMLIGMLLSFSIALLEQFALALQLETFAQILYVVSLGFTIICFFPSVNLTTRRLHDLGESGWWQLWVIIILFIASLVMGSFFHSTGKLFDWDPELTSVIPNLLMLLIVLGYFAVLLFKDGQKHPNKYGESPKYPSYEPEVSTVVVAETETSGEMK